MLTLREVAGRHSVLPPVDRAADRLSTLAPLGDPAFAAVRGELAKDFAEPANLDSMLALHPSLPTLGELFQGKQALFIHATSSPYRDRSHFDGQNVLETGGAAPYQLKDGWLNRTLGLLPGGTQALAVRPNAPAALRGPCEAPSYGNSGLPYQRRPASPGGPASRRDAQLPSCGTPH